MLKLDRLTYGILGINKIRRPTYTTSEIYIYLHLRQRYSPERGSEKKIPLCVCVCVCVCDFILTSASRYLDIVTTTYKLHRCYINCERKQGWNQLCFRLFQVEYPTVVISKQNKKAFQLNVNHPISSQSSQLEHVKIEENQGWVGALG